MIDRCSLLLSETNPPTPSLGLKQTVLDRGHFSDTFKPSDAVIFLESVHATTFETLLDFGNFIFYLLILRTVGSDSYF